MLIFDGDGRLYEAGGELLANTDGRNGSPQISVTIPSGGFLVAFGPQADARLHACKARARSRAACSTTPRCPSSAASPAATTRRPTGSPSPVPAGGGDGGHEALSVHRQQRDLLQRHAAEVQAPLRAAGEDVSVAYCTFGSAYLHQYADGANERGAYLRRRLAKALRLRRAARRRGRYIRPERRGAARAAAAACGKTARGRCCICATPTRTTTARGWRIPTRWRRTMRRCPKKYGLPVAPAARSRSGR